MHAGVAVVLCCQSGVKHNIKLSSLSREDGEDLTYPYLETEGAKLLMTLKKKSYPVKFISFKGTCIYINHIL